MPDQEQPPPVITPIREPGDQDAKDLRVLLMKQQAVRQAMTEVLQMNRMRIIRLAAKKLRAMGVEVKETELDLV